MTVVLPGVQVVYANWGRWVADCGWCDSAFQLVPFAAGFACTDCGRSTEVVWPSADMVAGVERLLLMRPNPKTQNWLPYESLSDLLAENAAHGVIRSSEGTMHIVGDLITSDTLPNLNPRRELT